jgi:uncharacterized protein YjeT (DUF2065 family)
MTFLAALALVLVIEGLVLALLPNRFEEVLRALAKMPRDRRRRNRASVTAAAVWLVRPLQLLLGPNTPCAERSGRRPDGGLCPRRAPVRARAPRSISPKKKGRGAYARSRTVTPM